jgi:hypothetical protein
MRTNFLLAALLMAAAGGAPAARLTPGAARAFEQYTRTVEARLAAERPHDGEDLFSGRTRIEAIHGGSWAVSGGLLHHWRGTALIPGARAAELLALLRDYDHLAKYYAPEVVSSRELAVDGDNARIAMRFRKRQIVTVVLDTEFDASSKVTGTSGFSISRSTHIWQVQQPGTPRERRRLEGDDDGYLWRLNSYWNFAETGRGLLIECEAVSLTRDVPLGLGWLAMPVIESLPRASLEFTLNATRSALARRPQELEVEP